MAKAHPSVKTLKAVNSAHTKLSKTVEKLNVAHTKPKLNYDKIGELAVQAQDQTSALNMALAVHESSTSLDQ